MTVNNGSIRMMYTMYIKFFNFLLRLGTDGLRHAVWWQKDKLLIAYNGRLFGAKNTDLQEPRLKRRLERHTRIESTKKQNQLDVSNMEIDDEKNQEDDDINNGDDTSAMHCDVQPVASSFGGKEIGIQVETAFYTTTFMDFVEHGK
ncbi:hypothetical protein KQX54_014362 [Cotesia glomerata]|uniref:Uncharacterized protein n=1 Tax=Cotesia glomerata TaxID=32391 RepID=A0AAV7HZ29_COTGL|nr:hypothetical protein KQX54_014362 [Cotesia glomerata]